MVLHRYPPPSSRDRGGGSSSSSGPQHPLRYDHRVPPPPPPPPPHHHHHQQQQQQQQQQQHAHQIQHHHHHPHAPHQQNQQPTLHQKNNRYYQRLDSTGKPEGSRMQPMLRPLPPPLPLAGQGQMPSGVSDQVYRINPPLPGHPVTPQPIMGIPLQKIAIQPGWDGRVYRDSYPGNLQRVEPPPTVISGQRLDTNLLLNRVIASRQAARVVNPLEGQRETFVRDNGTIIEHFQAKPIVEPVGRAGHIEADLFRETARSYPPFQSRGRTSGFERENKDSPLYADKLPARHVNHHPDYRQESSKDGRKRSRDQSPQSEILRTSKRRVTENTSPLRQVREVSGGRNITLQRDMETHDMQLALSKSPNRKEFDLRSTLCDDARRTNSESSFGRYTPDSHGRSKGISDARGRRETDEQCHSLVSDTRVCRVAPDQQAHHNSEVRTDSAAEKIRKHLDYLLEQPNIGKSASENLSSYSEGKPSLLLKEDLYSGHSEFTKGSLVEEYHIDAPLVEPDERVKSFPRKAKRESTTILLKDRELVGKEPKENKGVENAPVHVTFNNSIAPNYPVDANHEMPTDQPKGTSKNSGEKETLLSINGLDAKSQETKIVSKENVVPPEQPTRMEANDILKSGDGDKPDQITDAVGLPCLESKGKQAGLPKTLPELCQNGHAGVEAELAKSVAECDNSNTSTVSQGCQSGIPPQDNQVKHLPDISNGWKDFRSNSLEELPCSSSTSLKIMEMSATCSIQHMSIPLTSENVDFDVDKAEGKNVRKNVDHVVDLSYKSDVRDTEISKSVSIKALKEDALITENISHELDKVIPEVTVSKELEPGASRPTNVSFGLRSATSYVPRQNSSLPTSRVHTWHRPSVSTNFSNLRPLATAGKAFVKQNLNSSPAYVRKGNSLVRAPVPPANSLFVTENPLSKISKLHSLKPSAGELPKVFVGNKGTIVSNDALHTGKNIHLKAQDLGNSTQPTMTTSSSPLPPPGLESSLNVSDIVIKSVAPVATSVPSEPTIENALKSASPADIVGSITLASVSPVLKEDKPGTELTSNKVVATAYVRNKANQLVVAALPHTLTKLGPSLSVSYVKRKTNQLVRNIKEASSSKKSDIDLNDKSVIPNVVMSKQKSLISKSNGFKRKTKLRKVFKKRVGLHSSRVWTLSAATGSADISAHSKLVTPSLIPWKRRSHTAVIQSSRLKMLPEGKKGSLLFFISKRLQMLRNAQPLYTRSASGFSLRRSGVRSVGGTNLKWTKSLERRSKQASEEATKAVAAFEKQSRNEKEAATEAAVAAAKAKADRRAARRAARGSKLHPRERIVLVGLVRYKMDPTQRTLQRLPESQESVDGKNISGNNSMLLTPRRASIGGALYVRVGNGNQLVRDPKASSRALASEKVRWSLHNARSRLAKKQLYCQFFTRFGKCNKGNGKCPYIHDPEKIAVCTKFLKGTCTASDCLLTHKVIPDRMPDCSYFLEGLCTNEQCPYRHVNVNRRAPVCEGFLRGYCIDGDKCNKKHTYVCPLYEETGECPNGRSCKLHHPIKKEKCCLASGGRKIGTKRKRRYFSTEDVVVGENVNLEVPAVRSDETSEFISLGETPDFISLNYMMSLANAGEPLPKKVRPISPWPELESLTFDGLSQEELEKLIKPDFVLEARKVSQTGPLGR